MQIYLDNASTTPVRPEVFEAMKPWLTEKYGNPSSHHELGREAAAALWKARETVASVINADPDEIFFTSGGSEANTWAINGLYCINNGGDVIMSSIEHHSLLNLRRRKKLIAVDHDGIIDLNSLSDGLEYNTPIVAVMMVNNEVGSIQPIKKIDDICYKATTFLHVDAVQAFGHIPINVKDYKAVSSMSGSAHKIGGPKGVGFLYIQKDVQELYRPLISGGQQENGLRGGTENIAGIVGFAKACELSVDEMQTEHDKNQILMKELVNNLIKRTNIHVNGPSVKSKNRVVSNLNIRVDGVRAEELIELLSSHGVYVSSGSACNSDSEEPSHVLTAIGLTDEEANSSIRITLGRTTTMEEINRATEIILRDINMLKGE